MGICPCLGVAWAKLMGFTIFVFCLDFLQYFSKTFPDHVFRTTRLEALRYICLMFVPFPKILSELVVVTQREAEETTAV